MAVSAAALTALGAETRPLGRLVGARASAELQALGPIIELASRCGEDVECWLAEVGSDDVAVVERTAYALGRLAEGSEPAVSALLGLLSYADIRVRLAALAGLDRAGVGQLAATRLREIAEEEGEFSRAGLAYAARFEARAARQAAETAQ